MPDKGWKQFERRVGVDLGGRRIPVTGIDRHGADVVTPMFHVQTKVRRSLPGWLWEWLGGIVATSTPAGKVGVLLLKKPRQKDVDALVVMRYGDFVDLHGNPEGRCYWCGGVVISTDGVCQHCGTKHE